jgi:olefin beta-lactone synthetase
LFSWGKLRLTEKVESFWQRLLKWPESSPYITVNVGPTRQFCNYSSHELRHWHRGRFESPDVKPDEMAAILYTSGSTGPAKGVVYTHGIFHTQIELLKQIYNIEAGEIDYCTFSLFALFGPALGMTCVVPSMNFSRPATIDGKTAIRHIHQYQITNMFASPAVLSELAYSAHMLDYPDNPAWKRFAIIDNPPAIPRANSIRRVISAGAPASFGILEATKTWIPESTQIFTPYGATEALPVTNIGSDELLETRALTESGHGICVGRPVPGVCVHIVPIRDDEIPVFQAEMALSPGQIGEFVACGPIVTKSYFSRDDATQLAKMHDPKTGDTLHRMGDVGYYDNQGRLWYCGRKSQRVVTENGTLYPDQVEAIFKPALSPRMRTALVGVRIGQRMTPVICFNLISKPSYHLDDPERLQARAQEFEMTKPITVFLPHPGRFPVDPRHNAKINREALAVWAAEQLRKTKS